MPEFPVDIPYTARQAKADYPTRPSDDLVREIKQFIGKTGTPHLWRGHTHTKPPQGAAAHRNLVDRNLVVADNSTALAQARPRQARLPRQS
jgi:hypothetical protein